MDCNADLQHDAAMLRTMLLTGQAVTTLQVSLPVVRGFVKRVEERALGVKVIKGVTPQQQLVKVVNDELIQLMGGRQEDLVDPQRGPQVCSGAPRPGAPPGCWNMPPARVLKIGAAHVSRGWRLVRPIGGSIAAMPATACLATGILVKLTGQCSAPAIGASSARSPLPSCSSLLSC